MSLFEGCLLACDLDGTLIFGDEIPKRNIEMIEFFVKEGGIFSVATGRSTRAVSEVFKNLNCIGPSVFLNGSLIFDYSKKEILHQYIIDSKCNFVVKKILELCPDIGIEAHSGGKVYIAQNSPTMQMHTDYEHIDVIYSSVDEVVNLPLNKVLYIPENQSVVKDLTEQLKTLNLNCSFVNSSATMYGKFFIFLEQLSKGVTKAEGLQFIKKEFSIKEGNFFAIGDFYNDMEMIKAADIGAATAEAPDEVKAAADYVTGPAEKGAVADFINYLITYKKGC
ncbi:MAG: HAD family hydrolase [Clostridia bacterium]|nr:HAD family hydrolase [Clostridia bacterium]